MTQADDSALLVVDIQNGFTSGGRLPVPDGEAVVPMVNRIARAFNHVVLTQDWHPAGHASFASSHPGRSPFETITLPYGEQTLWPDHCVQDTHDAAFHPDLDIPHARLIVRKGYHDAIDSYSAFFAADRITTTGLAGYLRDHAVDNIFICGLALDFCVAWTALDARRLGFTVTVIEDACRAIDLDGSLDKAWQAMLAAGVSRLPSSRLSPVTTD